MDRNRLRKMLDEKTSLDSATTVDACYVELSADLPKLVRVAVESTESWFKDHQEVMPHVMFLKDDHCQIVHVGGMMTGEASKHALANIIQELIEKGVPEVVHVMDIWAVRKQTKESMVDLRKYESLGDHPDAEEAIHICHSSIRGDIVVQRYYKDGEFLGPWQQLHDSVTCEGKFANLFRKAQREMGKKGMN